LQAFSLLLVVGWLLLRNIYSRKGNDFATTQIEEIQKKKNLQNPEKVLTHLTLFTLME
jgi:hypothetical protein